MLRSMMRVTAALALLMAATRGSEAGIVTTYYGDDDGFGIGATSGTLNPDVSNASLGEAPFTDVRLIGGGFFVAPAFTPTGSFALFAIPLGETITGATLTMRTGAWDTTPPPVGPGSNQIVLNGVAVGSSFLSQFNANTGTGALIETHSIALDASFFPLLTSGIVSLNGSNLTESSGSGSFQVDFLRLDITTSAVAAVPEPSTLYGGVLAGLVGLGAAWRRRVAAA